MRECIPILKPVHKSFIEVLLDIEWRTQSPEAISLYKKFVDDLMDVHTHYYKFVLDKLLVKLKSSVNPWDGLEIPSDELEKQNHIHDIFRAFLKNRPLSSDILMSSLMSAYPHYLLSTQVNKVYLLALLQVTEYAPVLRRDILFLIIKKWVPSHESKPVLSTFQVGISHDFNYGKYPVYKTSLGFTNQKKSTVRFMFNHMSHKKSWFNFSKSCYVNWSTVKKY